MPPQHAAGVGTGGGGRGGVGGVGGQELLVKPVERLEQSYVNNSRFPVLQPWQTEHLEHCAFPPYL